MMKKWICGTLVLLTIAVSCKKEDIEVYNGKPRMEFVSTYTDCVFNDRDYLDKTTERVVEVEVRALGHFSEVPLKYVLQEKEVTGNVVLQPEYEFVSKNGVGTAQVRVKRPRNVGSYWESELVFDMTAFDDAFEPGRTENLKCRLVTSFALEPEGWSVDLWGIYSNNKYIFMMEQLGQVYAGMEHIKAVRNQVRNAYKEYRKKNPPLMDDENPQHEITFPID